MNKRYDTTSALLRYIAGVFSLVAFVLLFGTIIYTNSGLHLKFADVFFNYNDSLTIAHVYGFVAQVLILLAGIFGVLIPIVGPFVENEKKCSYIGGGILVAAGAVVILLRVFFPLFEQVTNFGNYHLYGTAIAAGSLAIIAGGFNIWAAFVKE